MSDLRVTVAGIQFQNPIILASGTAAFGRSLAGVVDLDALGGIVTKAVSLEPRGGNSSPRVAEFPGGMLNAVGLANPGVDAVRRDELPWLAEHVKRARVIVNVVGSRTEEFAEVIRRLDDSTIISAFELNVSCPNVRAGGIEFCADSASLAAVVSGARAATSRPIFVKLSPVLPNIGEAATTAAGAGADGITVINTLPGLVVDVDSRTPRIGFGTGGTSGPGLLPVGVLATHRVRSAVSLPIIGVGGVASATDALQYIIAGASLVGVGTANLRDPRTAERIARELDRWCNRSGVKAIQELVGTLAWPV
ncbi:MAG TPA: dihydroorotate dehydrogenase [Gemmatimonadaceae bacterium]